LLVLLFTCAAVVVPPPFNAMAWFAIAAGDVLVFAVVLLPLLLGVAVLLLPPTLPKAAIFAAVIAAAVFAVDELLDLLVVVLDFFEPLPLLDPGAVA
jgi:hypothetical protein